MNRRTIDILSRLLLFAVPVACSTLPIGTVTEPPVIIVRNSTGADLAKATLSEAAGGNRAFQYGSISPVPRGASQIFVRPTKPQKLPKTVNLEWIDDQGIRHSRELSLMKVLQTATGTKGEAIVFDIWPRGDVAVFLERSEAYAGKEMENIEWRLVDVDGRTISPSINENGHTLNSIRRRNKLWDIQDATTSLQDIRWKVLRSPLGQSALHGAPVMDLRMK